nr:family 16 glycosylhydrolase [uncultured Carboxylicivirga sp.]
MKKVYLFIFALSFTIIAGAQGYELVWEENFDGDALNPAIWNVEQSEGIWNTGSNSELQHYTADNVTVGDDGSGNNCLILTAKKENYNGYAFTSGRINSKSKFAFKYGKIEARIKLPDLANGLWPAFWLLGNTQAGWPSCGEIDILEAGHADGITNNQQNTTFGGALHWEYNDGYAGYGYSSQAPTALNNDFHTFSMVWSATNISMYLDGSSTPYYSMNVDGSDAEEFRDYSMYLLLNLAVGGMFPDIYNEAGITAPMPAQMLVDYIKVYQKTGEGELVTSMPLYGDLAVYADGKSYDNALDLGFDATLSSTGVTARSGETAVEGSEVLSYNVTAGNAFNINILSSAIQDLSAISSTGSIDVYIKTNIQDDLLIGLGDTDDKTSLMTVGSSTPYNVSRDETWSRLAIPLQNLSNIDFTKIDDVFTLQGTSTADGYISIDKIILSNTTANFNLFGIFTENPSITEKFIIDDISGHLYIWNNTMEAIEEAPTYDGNDVLAFTSPATNTWFGYGLFSDAGLDLSQFANGYLKFSLRTSSSADFWVGVGGANNTEAKIHFVEGSDPNGFVRDGKWHQITLAVSDMVAQGLDLSSCGNVFMLGGAPYISDILVDDIFFAANPENIGNTAYNPNCDAALPGSDNTGITAEYFGIYTENSNVTERFAIDDVKGHIYIWEGTLSALTGGTPYDGVDQLYFKSGNAGWYGFGIFSDDALNLTHYANGTLSLSLKTSSSNDFWFGIAGAAGTEGKITCSSTSGYNIDRDGEWHRVIIPMQELIAQGLDLNACGNIFMLGGSSITDIAIDDVILTAGTTQPNNPDANIPSAVKNMTADQVRMYPVPANDILNIEASESIESVEIINQMGMISVSRKNLENNRIELPVHNLAKGIYLIKISYSKGGSVVKKLIKK